MKRKQVSKKPTVKKKAAAKRKTARVKVKQFREGLFTFTLQTKGRSVLLTVRDPSNAVVAMGAGTTANEARERALDSATTEDVRLALQTTVFT